MTHTPGPWKVDSGSRGTLCVVSEDTWICGELQSPNDPPPEPEIIANARLIAAAPELLSVLETIMRPYGMYDSAVHGAKGAMQTTFLIIGAEIKAAIAKARHIP